MRLRIKISIIYILLIAALGVVFVIFTSRFVEERMKEEEDEYFESLTQTLALNSANAIVLKDYAALSGIVDNVAAKGEHVIYAIILDENGMVIAHSSHEFEGRFLNDPVSLKADAADDIVMQEAGFDFKDVTAPLMIAGQKWGAVRIGFSLGEMNLKVAKARNIILSTGLISTFIGMVTSILLAKRITDPLHKLHRGADIISGGNFNHTVDISTGDEIEQLATAFNTMTAHLQQNYLIIERGKKEWEGTFDAISDPLFTHDKEFKVIRCNRAYAEAAGLPFQEIIGKPYYEIFPKTEGPMKGYRNALEMQEEKGEELFLPDQGKTYNASFYPVKDIDGKYLYFVHILRDITAKIKAEEEIHELFVAALASLSIALEAKSPWTNGHSERVTEYAFKIGLEMGLSGKELDDLRIAGLLHDIGKIGTYDGILDKAGNLTDNEYEIVKRHPGKGAEMISPIKPLKDLIPWIKGHHERYDGSGYPDGLKGEEIPIQARILAVADAYDSMTAERPYRKTPGKEKAIEELKRFSGIQFDPDVVEAFLKTI